MLKTNKSTKKRFKITKNGKVLFRPAGIGHFQAKKSRNQKRRNQGYVELTGPLAKQVKKMMPYS